MIVVADSSPLNYLVQIGLDHLLKALYGRVLVPESVLAELQNRRTPAAVLAWAGRAHEEIEVCRVSQPPSSIGNLGEGERDAIQLALERHADMLLIDEKRGRVEAQRRGLPTTGTLGILIVAGQRGLVDAERAIVQLAGRTNFRISPKLRDEMIQRARASRSSGK